MNALAEPLRYAVLIEKGETSYGAWVPDLPGCVAVGESEEEVLHLIRGTVELHISAMRRDGDPSPSPTTVAD